MAAALLRLDPPLPLDTPYGPGMAHILIDYGYEEHLVWVCFIDATGECWSVRNDKVRMPPNETARPK